MLKSALERLTAAHRRTGFFGRLARAFFHVVGGRVPAAFGWPRPSCLGKGLLSVELPLTIAIGLLMFGGVALIFSLAARARRAGRGSRTGTARFGPGAILAGLAFVAALCCSAPARAETLPPAAQPGASAGAQEVVAAGPSSAANHTAGGEANLKLPDLSSVKFLGINGRILLMVGLAVCAAGLLFGLSIFVQLKNRAVHSSMRE